MFVSLTVFHVIQPERKYFPASKLTSCDAQRLVESMFFTYIVCNSLNFSTFQIQYKDGERRMLPLPVPPHSLAGGVPSKAAGKADCTNRHDEDELVDS